MATKSAVLECGCIVRWTGMGKTARQRAKRNHEAVCRPYREFRESRRAEADGWPRQERMPLLVPESKTPEKFYQGPEPSRWGTAYVGPEEILKAIEEKYQLIVRSQHHIQIKVGVGQYHDFWIAEHGLVLKVRLYGQQRPEIFHDSAKLLGRLAEYKIEHTDLSELRRLEKLIELATHRPGVWVDAGWKDGRARIAIIRVVTNSHYDVVVRRFDASDPTQAEKMAIELACSMFEGVIYTDCRSLAGGRVVWVPREENRLADRHASLRGS